MNFQVNKVRQNLPVRYQFETTGAFYSARFAATAVMWLPAATKTIK
jgi:hypothetical protein